MDKVALTALFAVQKRIPAMPKPYVDSSSPLILWFRTDLRLQDHPGVAAAVEPGRPIVPVYIFDEALPTRPLGAASKWWLHRSLHSLDESLRALGSRLIIRQGNSQAALSGIVEEIKAKTVSCSHTFDLKIEDFDQFLANHLEARYVDFHRHNATLLTPPNWVRTSSGTPFRVFTPFYKSLRGQGIFAPHEPAGPPSGDWPAPKHWPKSLTVADLGLSNTRTPSGRDWAAGFDRFAPGEHGARKALRRFIDNHFATYVDDRDRPDKDATSHLSPHLRFGEISPQRVLYEITKAIEDDPRLAAGAAKFQSELAWREFSYGLLDQQPQLDHVNFRQNFGRIPWRNDDKGFRTWRRGETGYPLVDAGMRELWQTGYMHNRVRMVCASFLVKHLLIDWRRGEQWFWDCLLDADPANNPANWQWVAGCGADAAPYFRIFNPISQADKFDPAGLYRARYVQAYQPANHSRKQRDLFESESESPSPQSYPQPIVDHAFARQRALDAYQHREPS